MIRGDSVAQRQKSAATEASVDRLSITCSEGKGTTTYFVPMLRKPPTDKTA
jgi:hypothetical protein